MGGVVTRRDILIGLLLGPLAAQLRRLLPPVAALPNARSSNQILQRTMMIDCESRGWVSVQFLSGGDPVGPAIQFQLNGRRTLAIPIPDILDLSRIAVRFEVVNAPMTFGNASFTVLGQQASVPETILEAITI